MKVSLLIVEDDSAVQATWQKAVTRFNSRREIDDLEFDINLAKSLNEAELILKSKNIDCVITDLRLEKDDRLGGEKVIAEARKLAGGPIAIMSGYLEEYESNDHGMAPVRPFVKESQNYREVLNWFNSLKKLIAISSQARHRFQKIYADIFHRSLWLGWNSSLSSSSPIDSKVRHLVTQIGEELTAGSMASMLLPEEYYVRPALRPRLLTGDLIKLDDLVYVVVTPPCDLANTDTPESILLSLCENSYGNYSTEISDKPSSEKIIGKMRQYLNQEKVPPSLHFLPEYLDMGPWFASFKKIKSLSRDQLNEDKMAEILRTRFASISPLFVSNLTHRFSSYIGRPGQPDIDPSAALSARKDLSLQEK